MPSQRARFGPFELDLRSGELCQGARRLSLQEQPFRVLQLILGNGSELTTREQIRKALWPNDTVVEFDHGINTAIKKIRQALGDSAEDPKYIETVARRGYRCMVTVEWPADASPADLLNGPIAVPGEGLGDPKDVGDGPAKLFEGASGSGGLSGKRFSHYRVLEILGGGGMGVVYKALDLKLDRAVALKFLPEEMGEDEKAVARFEREARAVSALDHPNICPIYEFGEQEGRPFIVMPLLDGRNLRDILAERDGDPAAGFAIEKVLELSIQIASGLEAAHDKGIIHRDIKPANIFITQRGIAKILDFGIAKMLPTGKSGESEGEDGPSVEHTAFKAETVQTQSLTRTGIAVGSAGYMSPEQVRGERLDARTDLFSFGLVLYEMISGQRAFQRLTPGETMSAILNDDPPDASQGSPKTPLELQRVLRRCLAKDPAQRFQSASDLAFALQGLRGNGSPVAPRQTRRIRNRAIGGLVGLATVALGIVIASRTHPSEVPLLEGVTQLTNDGAPKIAAMASDGPRVYFTEGTLGAFRIAQVSVSGGATAPVQTPFENFVVVGVKPDGSELLAGVPIVGSFGEFFPWSIPLPAGEPRQLGSSEADGADIFKDGRIVFAKFIRGADAKGTGRTTDWFIADKDGLNPRKLVSLAGNVGEVSVAPDGRRILLSDEHDGVRRLLDIAPDGTDLREIRKLRPGECCFRWTQDQNYLVYQSGSEQRSDIWALPMGSGLFRRQGESIRLTNGPLPYVFPYPSRDGKQIFVLGTKARGELVRYDMKSNQFLPFFGGISATDPSFSRDGKWVAYTSYPDHILWRSRSDGSERMQLTYPPMDARFPYISPDGSKVSFHTCCDKFEVFVIGMNGGTPQKVGENLWWATWSPDGNYLFSRSTVSPFPAEIVDVSTGRKSAVPSSDGVGGFWVTQDTLITANQEQTKFQTFNLRTLVWSDLGPEIAGKIVNVMLSPDGKYLYFTTGGVEPKAERLRLSDGEIETITGLKDFHRALNNGDTQINVAPDGSPIFTRDTGYQEIYALNVRWP